MRILPVLGQPHLHPRQGGADGRADTPPELLHRGCAAGLGQTIALKQRHTGSEQELAELHAHGRAACDREAEAAPKTLANAPVRGDVGHGVTELAEAGPAPVCARTLPRERPDSLDQPLTDGPLREALLPPARERLEDARHANEDRRAHLGEVLRDRAEPLEKVVTAPAAITLR